ncbi:hypothetical protein BJY54_006917 [Streptomyces nodosus]|nr:hypothetical protein [Streptomyces nodosus]
MAFRLDRSVNRVPQLAHTGPWASRSALCCSAARGSCSLYYRSRGSYSACWRVSCAFSGGGCRSPPGVSGSARGRSAGRSPRPGRAQGGCAASSLAMPRAPAPCGALPACGLRSREWNAVHRRCAPRHRVRGIGCTQWPVPLLRRGPGCCGRCACWSSSRTGCGPSLFARSAAPRHQRVHIRGRGGSSRLAGKRRVSMTSSWSSPTSWWRLLSASLGTALGGGGIWSGHIASAQTSMSGRCPAQRGRCFALSVAERL